MNPETPDTPKNRPERLVKALRKAGEGLTPEQIEAWIAEIDRGRHPELYCQGCGASLNTATLIVDTSGITTTESQPRSDSKN